MKCYETFKVWPRRYNIRFTLDCHTTNRLLLAYIFHPEHIHEFFKSFEISHTPFDLQLELEIIHFIFLPRLNITEKSLIRLLFLSPPWYEIAGISISKLYTSELLKELRDLICLIKWWSASEVWISRTTV